MYIRYASLDSTWKAWSREPSKISKNTTNSIANTNNNKL